MHSIQKKKKERRRKYLFNEITKNKTQQANRNASLLLTFLYLELAISQSEAALFHSRSQL